MKEEWTVAVFLFDLLLHTASQVALPILQSLLFGEVYSELQPISMS